MKNRIITLILSAALIFSLAGVAGCDASGSASADDSKIIKVGANITPHSEILEQAQPLLAAKGITLEIVKL